MKEELFEAKLSQYLTIVQRKGGQLNLAGLTDHLLKEKVVISPEDVLNAGSKVAKIFRRHAGYLYTPSVLREVIAQLLIGRSATTICDPWAGLGTILAAAQEMVSASKCIAFNLNASEGDLGRVLFPGADWRIGQPLRLLDELAEPLDVVVSNLPFGVRANETLILNGQDGEKIELRDDLAHLILTSATARLNADGLGIFVVPPSFFFSKRSVLHQFKALGFGVAAAFELPSGTFAPYTSIATYLVVVKKELVAKLFVAQLSADPNTNRQIVSNFKESTEGGALELGSYVNPHEFRGIDALRADDYFANATKQIGFPAIDLASLATGVNLGHYGDAFSFPKVENAIFVPLIGESDVVDSIEELRLKMQNYAQVTINPTKSYAKFVAQFLNSELGKKTREWNKSGSVIPKLNKQTLNRLQILVPDIATQQQILEVEAQLSIEENTLLSLQNELAELRRELWKKPRSACGIEKRLNAFSQRITGELKEQASTTLDQWFETLPFPLASILRAWQATPSDDFKTKYEHLLHFFEATAEFLSVIFLSSFSANEALFESHREKLAETMKKQNLSFQRATFGTWKLVVEYFGKQTRLMLQDTKGDRETCSTIFADSSLILPTCLSDKGIASVLRTTNRMRNDWGGHSGVVGQDEAKIRNDQLLGEVLKFREAMADVWSDSVLVHSLHCRPRNGIFDNELAILMGSNSEFLKESVSMSTWLDVERLYIIKRNAPNALKLLPLVQVGPSPQSAKNACYFFNRIAREGARFVSYHFSDQPELTGEFEEAADTIKYLTEI